MAQRLRASQKGPFANGHGLVPGAALYQKVREALSVQGFDDKTWPTAAIDELGVKALATVQPDPEGLVKLTGSELEIARARMWELVRGMDDLTADVMDAVACLWIPQAASKDQMVWLTADQFLAFRGLQPHRNSAGRESGYKDQQRRLIAEHLQRLENTWIDVVEMEILEEYRTADGQIRRRRKKWKGRSRALIRSSEAGQATLDGGVDPYAWRVRPGDVFSEFLLGPGRDVALLSRKALEYDPYRQDVEKRLARFFAYHWRAKPGGEQPRFTVATLLEAAHKPLSTRHPVRTKERLEHALLTLALDQVITITGLMEAIEKLPQGGGKPPTPEQVDELLKSGELVLSEYLYGGAFHDDQVGVRSWTEVWLRQVVRVEAPPALRELYATLGIESGENAEPDLDQGDTKRPAKKDWVDRLTETREALGISLTEAAAQIGLSKGYLSLIESRGRRPSAASEALIKTWVTRVSGENT